MNTQLPYKRILLKISGETLMGDQPFGIDQKACLTVAHAIQTLRRANIEVAIVIGGGNIFRGIHLEAIGLERTPADHMGMLATLINGIAMQQALTKVGCPAKVMSALECPKVAEPFTWRAAIRDLPSHVLIFSGGTGNPYFTTDTAAALRANEINADILIKATKVDGIYDKDPKKNNDAKKYQTLSYSQALTERLAVMDATALTLCRNQQIPIYVFNMKLLTKETIIEALNNTNIGTLVKGD